jgi:hypothetical protein
MLGVEPAPRAGVTPAIGRVAEGMVRVGQATTAIVGRMECGGGVVGTVTAVGRLLGVL